MQIVYSTLTAECCAQCHPNGWQKETSTTVSATPDGQLPINSIDFQQVNEGSQELVDGMSKRERHVNQESATGCKNKVS